jgi:hypothetical protein
MLYSSEHKLLTDWKEVPNSIALLLCRCSILRGSSSVYRDGSKGDPLLDWTTGKCTKCRKYDISRAYTCTHCGKHYVKNFKHPFWCYYHNPVCWDCIENTETRICGIENDCAGIRSWHERIPPPEVALRSVKVTWTQEEQDLFG